MSDVITPRFNYDFPLPNGMDLAMHFAPHGSAEDLPPTDELCELIQASDMVIIEATGTTEEGDYVMQRNANGDKKAQEMILKRTPDMANASWQNKLYGALFASLVRVRTVDLPYGHPLLNASDMVLDLMLQYAVQPNFQHARTDYHKALTKRLQLMQARDQYILNNFEDRVGKHAGLKRVGGRAVKAMMIYGSSHAPLHTAFEIRATHPDQQDKDFTANIASEPDYPISPKQAYEEYLTIGSISEETSLEHMMHHVLQYVWEQTGRIDRDAGGEFLVKAINEELAGLDEQGMRKLRAKALWGLR